MKQHAFEMIIKYV